MRTAAVLPVKRFARAKSRLGDSVAEQLRLSLARAMVDDVLTALAQTPAIERTILVTGEPSLAGTDRALLVHDEAEQGQSAAALLGIQRALTDGFQRVLCIPGDCPALDSAELHSLLISRPAEDREVVIVPDRHGTGTNGLLLTPPDAIAPSFGPDSCERHRSLAAAANVPCRLEHPSSLLLDIDTGADLQALRDRLDGPRSRAPRTRAVLGQPEPIDLLSINTTG